jgi:hypothetical protein
MANVLVPGPADRRTVFGVALTFVWVAVGAFYIGRGLGWQRFFDQPLGEMGDFLDGAFAPLAFLWLVLGLFIQQRELARNNEAIQRQHDIMLRTAESAEIQTRAIAANELHARQDTFIDLAQLVGNQLEVISGMLFLSSQGFVGDGVVSDDEMDQLWGRMSSGESGVFSRRLLLLRVNSDPVPAWALFWGTPIRKRHCENFVHSFERLLHAAASCDPDGMIADAVRGGAQGRLYEVMRALRDNPPQGATPLAA